MPADLNSQHIETPRTGTTVELASMYCTNHGMNLREFALYVRGQIQIASVVNGQHWIERFSIACRKSKTKAFTMCNHNRRTHRNDLITIPSNYM